MSNGYIYNGNTFSGGPQRNGRRRISPEERRRRRKRALMMRRIKVIAFLVLAGGLLGLLTAAIYNRGGGGSQTVDLPNGGYTASEPGGTAITATEPPATATATPTDTTTPMPASQTPDSGEAEDDESLHSNINAAAVEDGTDKLAINTFTDDKYIMLVNKTYKLDETFVPENLVDISKRVSSLKADIYLEKKAAEQYELMTKKMSADGITDLVAASGYRDYEYQKGLFSRQVEKHSRTMSAAEAEAEAAKIVAPPGTSEHQSGLVIDVTTPGMSYALEEWFEDTNAYKWLAENAWEYGFIIRYAKDKYDITKISYEPWHLRYVGREHAEQMKSSGLCLEEYLGKM